MILFRQQRRMGMKANDVITVYGILALIAITVIKNHSDWLPFSFEKESIHEQLRSVIMKKPPELSTIAPCSGQPDGLFIKYLNALEKRIYFSVNCQSQKANGTYTEYDKGQVIIEAEYTNDKPNGEASFYENGERIKKSVYKNGKETSFQIFDPRTKVMMTEMTPQEDSVQYFKLYYKSGALYSEVPIKEGKRDGVSKNFYETGEIMSEIPFVKGQIDGTVINYFKDGKIASKREYQKDQLNGLFQDYDSDGEIMREQTYKKGKPLYSEKLYFENRRLILERELLKDGSFGPLRLIQDGDSQPPFDGLYVGTYKDGRMHARFGTKEGLINGSFTVYVSGGLPYVEAFYKDGLLDGTYKRYDLNNTLIEKSTYKNGLLDGVSYKYSYTGAEIEQAYYKDGKKMTREEYEKAIHEEENIEEASQQEQEKSSSETSGS